MLPRTSQQYCQKSQSSCGSHHQAIGLDRRFIFCLSGPYLSFPVRLRGFNNPSIATDVTLRGSSPVAPASDNHGLICFIRTFDIVKLIADLVAAQHAKRLPVKLQRENRVRVRDHRTSVSANLSQCIRLRSRHQSCDLWRLITNDTGGVRMFKSVGGTCRVSTRCLSSSALAPDKRKVGRPATLEGTYTVLGRGDGKPIRGQSYVVHTLGKKIGDRKSSSSSRRPSQRLIPPFAPCAS